jgi:hypothetical protein
MCPLLSRTKAIRTSGNHDFLPRLQKSESHVSDDMVSVEFDPRCPPPVVSASSPIFFSRIHVLFLISTIRIPHIRIPHIYFTSTRPRHPSSMFSLSPRSLPLCSRHPFYSLDMRFFPFFVPSVRFSSVPTTHEFLDRYSNSVFQLASLSGRFFTSTCDYTG